MMFSDAPISSVGVLARIPNRWTKETELFIVEFTRNTNGFPDALTGETRAGLRVFRFVERLYQFNGSSIFYCPLKTVGAVTLSPFIVSVISHSPGIGAQ